MRITFLSGSKAKGSSLQTTVPSEIVRKLNLKKGDRLVWTVENGVIVIHPVNEDA
ncbi:MAG: AbrB/MazE/SpoVT family DNA-binding domain-containing protein [Archaeoglobaceae archaeon]